MKAINYSPLVLLASLLLLGGCSLSADESVVTPSMIGHWEGKGRIIVSWCHQKELPIAVDIDADGGVKGKIGDATLTQGRLSRNRGWLGRKLNIASDYLIHGQLTGPIIAAEGITRSGVNMPLNFTNETFVGGLHTTGMKFGGKEGMTLSATAFRLKRTDVP